MLAVCPTEPPVKTCDEYIPIRILEKENGELHFILDIPGGYAMPLELLVPDLQQTKVFWSDIDSYDTLTNTITLAQDQLKTTVLLTLLHELGHAMDSKARPLRTHMTTALKLFTIYYDMLVYNIIDTVFSSKSPFHMLYITPVTRFGERLHHLKYKIARRDERTAWKYALNTLRRLHRFGAPVYTVLTRTHYIRHVQDKLQNYLMCHILELANAYIVPSYLNRNDLRTHGSDETTQ